MKKLIAVITVLLSPSVIAVIPDYRVRTHEFVYEVRTLRSHAELINCDLRTNVTPARDLMEGVSVERIKMRRYAGDPTLYKGETLRPLKAYAWVTCAEEMNATVGSFVWERYTVGYHPTARGPEVNMGSTRELTIRPEYRIPEPVRVQAEVISWERARLENLRIEPGSNNIRGTIVPEEPGEYRITLLVTATLK